MKGQAYLAAEIDKLLFLGKELHHLVIVFHFSEAANLICRRRTFRKKLRMRR